MSTRKSFFWILDNGQGGFIKGLYQSPGKQSPPLPDGSILYEGEFTRNIVDRIAEKCREAGILHKKVVPTEEDWPLNRRIEIANELNNSHPGCMLISVRLNSNSSVDPTDFSSSNGISAYFYKKEQRSWLWNSPKHKNVLSKNMGLIFLDYLQQHTGMRKRGVKGVRHELLGKANMPAVIIKCGFMDNLQDCQGLQSDQLRERIAEAYFQAINHINSIGTNGLLQDSPTSSFRTQATALFF